MSNPEANYGTKRIFFVLTMLVLLPSTFVVGRESASAEDNHISHIEIVQGPALDEHVTAARSDHSTLRADLNRLRGEMSAIVARGKRLQAEIESLKLDNARLRQEKIDLIRRKKARNFLKKKIKTPKRLDKDKYVVAARKGHLYTLLQYTELLDDEEKAMDAWDFTGKCLRNGVGTPQDIIDRYGAEVEAKIRKVVEAAPFSKQPRTHEQYIKNINYWHDNDIEHFRDFAPFYETGRPSFSTLTENVVSERNRRGRSRAIDLFNQGGRR